MRQPVASPLTGPLARPPARRGRPPSSAVITPLGIDRADQLADSEGPAVDLGRHPAFVYLARLAPGSRRTMQSTLGLVALALGGPGATIGAFPWADLRYQHTAALRAALWERYAPNTANKILAAVRGVLREAWRLGMMGADDFQRATDVRAVRGTVPLRGRALAREEIRVLFALCAHDAGPAGVRDAALLGVLYGAGLRRAEAVALDVQDYMSDTGALRVRGKGNKVRIAYVQGGAARALAAWLEVRGRAPDRRGALPLFTRLYKGGVTTPHRLTPQAVLDILRRRGRVAALPPFSPHDIRRTFIGDLLDGGVDLSTVQQMAGHAQVTTTARYDRRGERAKRSAAAVLDVPYITPGERE